MVWLNATNSVFILSFLPLPFTEGILNNPRELSGQSWWEERRVIWAVLCLADPQRTVTSWRDFVSSICLHLLCCPHRYSIEQYQPPSASEDSISLCQLPFKLQVYVCLPISFLNNVSLSNPSFSPMKRISPFCIPAFPFSLFFFLSPKTFNHLGYF